MNEFFRKIARKVSEGVGSSWSFIMAVLIIVIWSITGPFFHCSDTWQLIINTGTTIVTFLIVFLIQNTQNRDSKEIHLKLDELIRAQKAARNELVDLEDCSDDELTYFKTEFINHEKFISRKEAKSGIFEYIEIYFNREKNIQP